MKKYEVSAQVNSFAWIVVEAANEEEAEAKARAIHWERWRLDTDYSTAELYEVRETEGVSVICGDCLYSLAICNCGRGRE